MENNTKIENNNLNKELDEENKNLNPTLTEMINDLNKYLYHDKITIKKEDLYNDKIYIEIFQSILKENISLKPEKDTTNKINNLKFIIKTLSNILDISLVHIDPYGIILSKDEDSVKYFLSIFLDLYSLLKNQNDDTTNTTENLDLNQQSKSVQNNDSFIKKKIDDNSINNDNSNTKHSLTISYIQEQKSKLTNKNTLSQRKLNNSKDKLSNRKNLSKEKKDNNLIKKIPGIEQGFFPINRDISEEDNKLKIYKLPQQNNNNIEPEDYPIYLSLEELKEKLIKLTKLIYSQKDYEKISKMPNFNNKMNDITIKIIQMYALKDSLHPITEQYFNINKKKISQILKLNLKPPSIDERKNLSMKYASNIIGNINLLKHFALLDYDNLKNQINEKRQKYEIEKNKSSQDLLRVQDIYITALNLEGERFIEEKNLQNEIMLMEEQKKIDESSLINEYLKGKKRDLEEEEKYERFKRAREKKMNSLSIKTTINN